MDKFKLEGQNLGRVFKFLHGCLHHALLSYWINNIGKFVKRNQGILKGEVSLYSWPPVWLVWNQLYDNWHFFVFICKTDLSKPVKQEVNGTVILPPLVFPAESFSIFLNIRKCTWVNGRLQLAFPLIFNYHFSQN